MAFARRDFVKNSLCGAFGAGLALAVDVPTVQAATSGSGIEVQNVKDFGAMGDGVTDDTASIRAAISAALASGGQHWVYFPEGVYVVSSTIDVSDTRSGLRLSGAVGGFGGNLVSYILFTGGSGPLIRMNSVYTFEIDHLNLYYNNPSMGQDLISSQWSAIHLDSQFVYIHDCSFQGAGGARNAHSFIGWDQVMTARIERCQFANANFAIVLASNGNYVNQTAIRDCIFSGMTTVAIVNVGPCANIVLTGNTFESLYSGKAGAMGNVGSNPYQGLTIIGNTIQDSLISGGPGFDIVAEGCEISGNFLDGYDEGDPTNVMFVFHNGSSGIHIAGNYITTNTLVNFIEPSTTDCVIEGNKLIVSTVALNSVNCNGLVTVIGGVVSASNNVLGGPSPLVSPGQVGLGSTTTTSAGAGSAILPTRPVGFLEVNIGGTTRKVPYYA